ncbi:flagellar hook capping FlgD N-terminal domain-containing protein [uncultured Aquitalea sp.]|uniref:flagellar hook assembly protein FlgD n=1 Tax=uncultured Aquitalea sp. TaxID=540272 RepID=UPI0025F4B506|nr:flagellar hook capping FlgD N-terminal domain-containing protein [uncultured Aquitalea sp.]
MSTSSTSGANAYSYLNGTSSASSGSSSSSTTSAQGIQDRFLKLLVAQLKAQDPSNPMDNSQITSQMAQISQVSGMQQLNTAMQSLVQSQAANQSMMAASMIGKEAMVPGNALTLSGGAAVQGGVKLSDSVSDLSVSIKDANGNVVDTVNVKSPSAGYNAFEWDGKDSNGNALPDGKYTFSVSTGSTSSVTATAYANQTVSAVSWVSGSPQLIMKDGTKVALGDVAQLS